MNNPFDEIYYSFRANLPVCGLQFATVQRLSVLAEIKTKIAKDPLDVPVFYWSLARGFEYLFLTHGGKQVALGDVPDELPMLFPGPEGNNPLEGALKRNGLTADNESNVQPDVAIQRVMNCDFPALFILHEFHKYLDNPRILALFNRLWDSLVLQEHKTLELQNGVQVPVRRYGGGIVKRVLLTGDRIELPQELRSHHQVYKVPLPGRKEVDAALAELCEKMEATNGIPTDMTLDERRLLISNLAGMPRELMEAIIRKVGRINGKIDGSAIALAKAERLRQLSEMKAKFLDEPENEVAGLDILMGWTRETLLPSIELRVRSEKPEKIPERRGMTMVGPPGTGKTLAASAICSELGVPGILLSMGDLMSSGLGDSESNLRQVLDAAEAIAPCCLVLDEIDKAFEEGGAKEGDGGTSRRMLGMLLQFMSKPKAKPVFVIMTMNRFHVGIPPEFTRTGRIDAVFRVSLPNCAGREDILKVLVRKYANKLKPKDFQNLANATNGYSGSDLAQLVNNCWYAVYNRIRQDNPGATEDDVVLTAKDLQGEVNAKRFVPSGTRFARDIKEIEALAECAIPASSPDVVNNGSQAKDSMSSISGMI